MSWFVGNSVQILWMDRGKRSLDLLAQTRENAKFEMPSGRMGVLHERFIIWS